MKNPIKSYVIVSAISLLCALALFWLGGSFAEVTGNQDSILGLGFKASGAVGGFIIIFTLSQKTIIKFYERSSQTESLINMKVYLTSQPNNFSRNDQTYEAEYKLFNEDSGDSTSFPAEHFWEAGYLTILVKNVGERDYVSVTVKNSNNDHWESESFHSRSPKIAELTKLN